MSDEDILIDIFCRRIVDDVEIRRHVKDNHETARWVSSVERCHGVDLRLTSSRAGKRS